MHPEETDSVHGLLLVLACTACSERGEEAGLLSRDYVRLQGPDRVIERTDPSNTKNAAGGWPGTRVSTRGAAFRPAKAQGHKL